MAQENLFTLLPKYKMFVCVITVCCVYAMSGVHERDRHFTEILYETIFKKVKKLMLSQLLDKRLSLLRNTRYKLALGYVFDKIVLLLC